MELDQLSGLVVIGGYILGLTICAVVWVLTVSLPEQRSRRK